VADVDPGAPLCVSFRLTLAEYRAAVRALSLALWPFRAFVVFTILAAIGALGSAAVGYEALAIGLFVVAVVYAALLAWVLIIRSAQTFNRCRICGTSRRIAFPTAKFPGLSGVVAQR
jgi:hypothetical protein